MSGESKNKLINSAISGFRWSASVRLCSQIISWITTLFVIRILTSEDYGLVSVAEIFTTLSLIFVNFGIARAIVQRKDLQHHEVQNALGISIAIGMLVYTVLFFAAPYIAVFYNHQSLTSVIRAVAFIFLLTPFQTVYGALLDRNLQYKQKALSNGLANIISAVVGIVLAYLSYGAWALVFASISQNFFLLLFYVLNSRTRYWPKINLAQNRDILQYTKKSFFAELLVFASNKTQSIIGGKIYGVAQLGLYSVSAQLAMLIATKVMPIFNQLGFSTFSRLNEMGDREAILRYLKTLVTAIAVSCFPLFCGIGITASTWVPLVLGENWLPAVPLLIFMTLVIPLRIKSEIISLAMEATDNTAQVIKIRLTSLTIGVITVSVLYAFGVGIFAMALASATASVVAFLLFTSSRFLTERLLGFVLRAAFPAIVSTGLMIVGIMLIDHSMTGQGNAASFLKLIAQIVGGSLVYLLTLALIARNQLVQTIGFFRTLAKR